MLVGVMIASYLLPGSPLDGGSSGLLGRYATLDHTSGTFAEWRYIFGRNMLVLLLHFFCCMIGAIIGRDHQPLPDRWQRFSVFHRQLPKWIGDLSLAYAFTVTLASIAIQTTGLGFILADLSSYSGLSPADLVLVILPHAPLELTAVFLPLALFLIQARRRQLEPLGRWVWQSFFIAVPMVAVAALIEISVTPHLMEWAIRQHGGLPPAI